MAILGLALPCTAHALVPDGYYDSTWAGGGRIVFAGDPSDGSDGLSLPRVVIAPNGDVSIAASVANSSGTVWWLGELFGSGAFAGNFVPTFGTSDGTGRVTPCKLGYACPVFEDLAGSVIQPDGKYLLATETLLWRTTANAAAFDTAGVSGGTGIVSNLFTVNDVGGSVKVSTFALLPNGQILAGGAAHYSSASVKPAFGVVRLNADLSLDTSFDAVMDGQGVTFAGGTVIQVSASDANEHVTAILPQSDHRIVLVGSASDGPAGSLFEAARINADGTPDTSYASSGSTALLWPGGKVTGEAMAAIDGADRVLVPFTATPTGTSSTGALVLRLGSDGTPDTTFNGSGFAFNANPASCTSVSGFALALDSAGRIVVTGWCVGYDNTANQAFSVLRVRGDDGSLDTTFGISGWGFGYFDAIDDQHAGYSIAFDPGGRPIVAGTSTSTAVGVQAGGASRITYDLILTNNFESAARGCLPPDCG